MSDFPETWTFELDRRATHMSLRPHDAPSGVVFATPVTIDEVVSTFSSSAATPAEVVELLELAAKLFRTSVVHYEFAALAVEKSLQALERAIRIRLGVNDRATLKQLIEQLQSEMELDHEVKDLLHTGRQIRNSFAHPARAPALPLVLVTKMLDTSYRLIADLFPINMTSSDGR